jgi:outer membrane murein-binding lipoprotein Lpp
MDPNALAGMVFTLLLAAMVGGFILLAPLSKRLGLLLEQKVNEKSQRLAAGEVRQLMQRVELLEQEVRSIAERQSFTDELLGKDTHATLPAAR